MEIGVWIRGTNLISWLPFKQNNKAHQNERAVHGSFQCSTRDFFDAHAPRLKLCASCADAFFVCDKCRFQLGALSPDVGGMQFVVKRSHRPIDATVLAECHTNNVPGEEIFYEAFLQSMLHRNHPLRVAGVLGDYRNFFYVWRKNSAVQKFYAAKIGVFIPAHTTKRSCSSQPLTSSDFSDDASSTAASDADAVAEAVARVQTSMFQLAVLWNERERITGFSIQWADRDFFAKHNYCLVTHRFMREMLCSIYGICDDEENDNDGSALSAVFYDFDQNIRLSLWSKLLQ